MLLGCRTVAILWSFCDWGLLGEKKNTMADLPTFKDGAFPISVWMYPACVTKKQTKTWKPVQSKYVPVHIMLNAVWSRFDRKRSVFTISCLLFYKLCIIMTHRLLFEQKEKRGCVNGATHTQKCVLCNS